MDEMLRIIQQQDDELASAKAQLSESERDRAALRAAWRTEEFSDTAEIVLQFVRINSKIADWATMVAEHVTRQIEEENVWHPTLQEVNNFQHSQSPGPIHQLSSSDPIDIDNFIFMLLSYFLAEALRTEVFLPFHPCFRNQAKGEFLSNMHGLVQKRGAQVLHFGICTCPISLLRKIHSLGRGIGEPLLFKLLKRRALALGSRGLYQLP